MMKLPRLPSSASGSPATLRTPLGPPAQRGAVQPGRLEVVQQQQMDEVMRLLLRDPVANVATLGWLNEAGQDVARLGAPLWGYWQGQFSDGQAGGKAQVLHALCYAGANLMPTRADAAAVQAFAAQARRWGRRCSSIVGPADTVSALWQVLAPVWGPARQVRASQPIMVLDQPVRSSPDARIRLVTPAELDVLMPASVAMFTEEVGVSPIAGPGRLHAYRARVAELIAAGQVFAWIENEQVLFKAEVGALAGQVAQIQGVWLAPHLRGQGLAAPAMAAVAQLVQVFLAPTVCLYVNDFNAPARATYAKVGFRDVGTAMTVML